MKADAVELSTLAALLATAAVVPTAAFAPVTTTTARRRGNVSSRKIYTYIC